MKVNQKIIRIAYLIASTLEKENCTVDETKEILTFIIGISGKQSTVQIRSVISELQEEYQKAVPAEIR